MGGISIWQLLIILAIVVLLFGTKRLKTLGSDLGTAIKGFKKAVDEKDADFEQNQQVADKRSETAETAGQKKTETKEH